MLLTSYCLITYAYRPTPTCSPVFSRERSIRDQRSIFTAQCYPPAVLATSLSVCLSVTSRCSTKTAKRRITKTTPHDTPGTLVFWCQRSPRNSTGVTPTGAPNAGAVVKIGDFRQITGYISKTVKDRPIVSNILKSNRKSYVLYRMMALPMNLSAS